MPYDFHISLLSHSCIMITLAADVTDTIGSTLTTVDSHLHAT